jgi:diguanylate cyclase (GGDEF)-like protein/PAS domain S-box-containing protein
MKKPDKTRQQLLDELQELKERTMESEETLRATRDKSKSKADGLRRQAEKRLRAKKAQVHTSRSKESAQRIVHELEVHQIELEMQNTELKRVQEELELSRNKYVELYDFAPVGYFTFDTQGLILEVNLTGAKLLGTERKLLFKKPFINFIAQTAGREVFSKHRKDVFQQQSTPTCEIQLKRKDGAVFFAQLQSVAKGNIDNKAGDIHTSIIDITVRKEIEAALQENDRRLNHVQEIAHLGSWDMDLLTDRLTWSDEAYRIFGFQPQEQDITYATFLDVVHPDDRVAVDAAYTDSVRKNRDTYEIEHRVVRQSTGEIRTVHERCEHIRDASGRIIRSIGMTHDITERKRMEDVLKENEKKYRELSIIDDLTQLYNSSHFYAQLEIEIERSNRYRQTLTLLLLDLDKFKDFNDTHGHIEGDYVLSRLGQVIKRCLRETDSAYRYGGEEFTIMLPMTTSNEGIVMAQRIQSELRKETFSPVLNKKNMTVSIGVTQYEPAEEMKIFVRRVDQLMYQAKKDGRDRICHDKIKHGSFIGTI